MWGLRKFRKDVMIEGVILNSVGSKRNEEMMRGDMEKIGVKVMGEMKRDKEI